MGTFANSSWVKVLAWTAAAIVVGLNGRLAVGALAEWVENPWLWGLVGPLSAALLALLAWVTFEPWISHWVRRFGRAPLTLPEPIPPALAVPAYHRILVTLDHTALDGQALAHAAALARMHGAKLHLLHVEEDVTSQVYGSLASTAEVEAGQDYLNRLADSLRKQGLEVETAVCHSSSPKSEIVAYARQVQPDLLVMGAHGHGGWKDLIFGDTINPVRHGVSAPVLVVRGPGTGQHRPVSR